MMKKFISLLIIPIIFGVFVGSTAFAAPPENNANRANTGANTGAQEEVNQDDCQRILGLHCWWEGVSGFKNGKIESEDEFKNGIWIIAANVATDVAIIAAYLILAYVIYGGYLYTFSAGDPSKVASAKKTLTHAFVGLAIVLSANLIMGTIRIALIGGTGNLGDCVTAEGCVTADQMVTNLVNWFIGIAGLISAVFLIYGGIQYITSTGDPGKVSKAKQTIMYSLIGLAVVALSATITAFVSTKIREANNNAYINNTTISKEVYETKIN